jgi:serine-type D-Ala-D-Ala carboxypeptidase
VRATILPSAAPSIVGMSPDRVSNAVRLFRGWTTHPDLRTIVALVARAGRVVIEDAAGPLTGEPDSPAAETDSVFPVFSMTKLFTATAVMMLVEEGKLGLHVPLSWYMPDLGGAGKDGVSLFHLLTHTSGIRDEEADGHRDKGWAERARAAFQAVPATSKPGAEMIYSSCGYDLAGLLVEAASGMPLAEFMARRIFEPLGMKNTSMTLPAALEGRAVRRAAGTMLDFTNDAGFRGRSFPSGSAWSTARDLAIFGQMFLDGGMIGGERILAPSTVAAMTRNQIPGVGSSFYGEVFPEASWGLGWSVVGTKRSTSFEQDLLSPQAFCHGGAGGMGLWVDPFYKVVAVYLIVPLPRVQGTCMGWCPDVFINVVMATIVGEAP